MVILKEILEYKNMDELKGIAREFNIRGFAKFRKAELILHLAKEMQSEDFKEELKKKLNKSMLILLNLVLTNQDIKYNDLKENFLKFRSIGTFYRTFNWLYSMALINESFSEIKDIIVLEEGETIEDYFENEAEAEGYNIFKSEAEFEEFFDSKINISNELIWLKEHVSQKIPNLDSEILEGTDKGKEEEEVEKEELVKELSLKEQIIKKLEQVSLKSSRSSRSFEGILIAISTFIHGYKGVDVDEIKHRTKIIRPTLIAKRDDEKVGISIWHFPNASKSKLLTLKGSLYDFKKEYGDNLIFYIYDLTGKAITNEVRKKLEEDTAVIYRTKQSFE